jgi:hypothetical protein
MVLERATTRRRPCVTTQDMRDDAEDVWNSTIGRTLPSRHHAEEDRMGRYFLLWMLGIPIPVLALIWLFGGLH